MRVITEKEKELIIKNTMNFLQRKDLVIINQFVTYPHLKRKDLEEYTVFEVHSHSKDYEYDNTLCIKYRKNEGRDYTYNTITVDDQNLIDLYEKTYNKLKAELEQQGEDTREENNVILNDFFKKTEM